MTQVESRIYLASRSPRRRELLHQIGVRFDLLVFRAPPREDSEVSEEVLPGETAEDYVVRVARAKAAHGSTLLAVRHVLPRPLLAADTTLDLDGEIIGKPRDEADAAAIGSSTPFRSSALPVASSRRGPRGYLLGKRMSPAPEMKKLRMMTASELLTTARVVAQPTPSEPPKVDSPEWELTIGIAAP